MEETDEERSYKGRDRQKRKLNERVHVTGRGPIIALFRSPGRDTCPDSPPSSSVFLEWHQTVIVQRMDVQALPLVLK